MRIKIVLLVALVGYAAAIPRVRDQWTSFKKNHGKSYHSAEEETFRRNIFAENVKMIEEHNAKYEAGLVSYSLAMNRFGDMLPEEVSMLAFNGTEQRKNLVGYSFLPPANVKLPESIDWRDLGAVTPIKTQGDCLSCWAFSTTGAIEAQLFRRTGELISLSEQQLVDCSRGYGNMGCNLGLMDYAYRYLQFIGGLEREDSYPYEGLDGKCRYKIDKVVPGTKVRTFINIRLHDDEALKSAVATVGPVSAGVHSGNKHFQFYDGGVFNGDTCPAGDSVDHGILVIGYGTEDGEDYWLIKNTWGTAWGEKGYMKLSRSKINNCGITTIASYPILV